MQPGFAGGTNIHSGPQPDRLKTFQDFNTSGIVTILFVQSQCCHTSLVFLIALLALYPRISNTHRHNNVTVIYALWRTFGSKLAGAVGIFEVEFHFGLIDGAQKIQQILRVETYL
jgi:hypothetical protein